MSDVTSENNVRQTIAPFVEIRGGLLPALHALQEALGHLPRSVVPAVADEFNISRAEVHGVISFYHDFREQPAGQRRIKICMAEACQAVGARELAAEAERAFGVTLGETSRDGQVTLEEVFCLGNCACGPSALIDGQPVGQATVEDLRQPAFENESLPQASSGVRVFVPRETTAVAMGAESVVAALLEEAATRNIDIQIVRNGSRGAHYLEPLIEVEVSDQRVAYGPVGCEDVAALFDGDFLNGGAHALRVGSPDDIDFLKGQDRQCLGRCGQDDPLSLECFQQRGGFQGLTNALALQPQKVVEEIQQSGLRGRGGAGFPAGIKWQTVRDQSAEEKFVVCNADEGDSGTFSDRLLMEGDPLTLIEGMIIAGYACGASAGYIYLRSEYPLTELVLKQAIDRCRDKGFLGVDVCGSGFAFDIELRIGAGSYVCGEETALLESLEGKRGQVRAKPPLPAIEGLFGAPTLVNNVITLGSVPAILADGAAAYEARGVGRSRGTLPVQLGGNIKRGGVVEVPFGLSLRELVEGYGGGTRSGRAIRAVQVGGPLGAYLPASLLDLPLDYEALAEAGGLLGHGGIVVFDDTVDMSAQARFAMEFCAIESCGKCTPCRIGSVRGVEVIDRILSEGINESNQTLLEDLLETMEDGSLCAMGGLTPLPVKSALKHFPEDFGARKAAAE